MAFSIVFELNFDNRSSDGVLQLDAPTLKNGSSLKGGFISSDFPQTLNPNSDTFKTTGTMQAGIGGDATDSHITIPYTVTNSKDSSKSVSGNIQLYLSGGNYYPDNLDIEVDCGDKSQVVPMAMDSTSEEISSGLFGAGTIDLLLSDAGFSISLKGATSISLTDIAGALSEVIELA
ncbi:MAG: hypothetical protein ACPF9D_00210 [Owenweeksia sp.]